MDELCLKRSHPVKLYTKLWTSTEFSKSATILNFDTVAYDRYQPRKSWQDLEGIAPNLLNGEDAQA